MSYFGEALIKLTLSGQLFKVFHHSDAINLATKLIPYFFGYKLVIFLIGHLTHFSVAYVKTDHVSEVLKLFFGLCLSLMIEHCAYRLRYFLF